MNAMLRGAFALSLLVATLVHADDSIESPQIEIVSADARVPLVELYTSEGCSSCPPADRWLSILGAALDSDAHDDALRAVPLAFHVDYWNYLGWTDPYAQASFTQRQREAAANNRHRTIYTPAFVVDGRLARRGDGMLRAIRDANAQTAQADIRARITHRNDDGDADHIAANIEIDNRADGARQAHIAVYESGITRDIGGGENRGRTLQYDFVVRHWSRPIWIKAGANEAAVEIEMGDDWNRAALGIAVIVINRRDGATVQAVRAPLAALFAG